MDGRNGERARLTLAFALFLQAGACAAPQATTGLATRPVTYDCGGGRSLTVSPSGAAGAVRVMTGDDSLDDTFVRASERGGVVTYTAERAAARLVLAERTAALTFSYDQSGYGSCAARG